MADHQKNQEIEDVLSSIRRLVTEHDAPRDGTDAPPAPEAEKLVLTPQLRVTEPEDPYQMIRALADADVQDTPAEDTEEAIAPPADLDPAPEPAPERRRVTLAAVKTDPAPDATQPAEDAYLEDTEDAVAAPGPEALAMFTHSPREDAEARPHAEAAEDTAETEDAILTTQDTDALDNGDDELLVDEETLRDLVAEVVREELAGALGEKITRNVRKLVRREIRKLMAAEDFE